MRKNKSREEDPGGVLGDVFGEGRELGRLLAMTSEQRSARSGVM